MWTDKMEQEFDFLTDEIKWDLKAVEEDSVVINTDSDKRVGGSDLAIEISKNASRLAEILRIFEKSMEYDQKTDK
ncbi:hypothetical protein FC72_GL001822 [Companilactobacillus tucceti DSM 20183]|uniref:Uncharacterized protein n=1 Tax=Companilactobacillus tucceti DSM 20183 TaxID=1423811 RepID=A0A0R1J1L2_9LACO|nr:hypothetical protein [Companilactobacillus tucceti]KRK64971.1 hypothetical protein FC72_GL001822 [Companilactobacillus tucceti DSM 20183]